MRVLSPSLRRRSPVGDFLQRACLHVEAKDAARPVLARRVGVVVGEEIASPCLERDVPAVARDRREDGRVVTLLETGVVGGDQLGPVDPIGGVAIEGNRGCRARENRDGGCR